VRIPRDVRAKLEAAARERGDRTLTDELVSRLRMSFHKEREYERDKGIRALCYLIAEAADAVHLRMPLKWHRDPFLFSAFKQAVATVLSAIEPVGEIKSPLSKMPKVAMAALDPNELKLISDRWQTPEITAERAAESVLRSLFLPEPLNAIGAPEKFKDEYYSMLDARRDLGINTLIDKLTEPKS
jgi:hypothetical protein